jgi:hypothetical protein
LELGLLRFTGELHDRDHPVPAGLLGLNGLWVSEACATTPETVVLIDLAARVGWFGPTPVR